jgi:hypothetical protein
MARGGDNRGTFRSAIGEKHMAYGSLLAEPFQILPEIPFLKMRREFAIRLLSIVEAIP